MLVLIVLLAAALRVPGLFTDFWGDEIWSWSIAGQLHSVADVLLAAPARIDNNHPLNTLWIYLIGQHQAIWLYRLPPFVAGVGAVIVGVRIMLRRGYVEAVIAALLLGFSYPLIVYSSEARGYSLVVFFSLLSFYFIQSALAQGNRRSSWAELSFGGACALGFLSHLTFLNIYAGAVAWSLVRVCQIESTTRGRLFRFIRIHWIPALSAALFFCFFVRDLTIGGATATPTIDLLIRTLSLTAGGPDAGPMAMVAAAVFVSLFIFGLVYLYRDGSGVWLFFLVAVVISPAATYTVNAYLSHQSHPLLFRYLLICMVAALLSCCPFLANRWRRGNLAQGVPVAGLLIFVTANLWNLNGFLELGRGHYAEAVAMIAKETNGSTIAVSSDNFNWATKFLRFYGPRVAKGRQFMVSEKPMMWLIINRESGDATPTFIYRGRLYLLKQAYLSSPLSGWQWWVYRAAS